MSNIPIVGYALFSANPNLNYLTEYKDINDYISKKNLLIEASGSVANNSVAGTRLLDNGVSSPLSGSNLTTNIIKSIYLDASQYPATIGSFSRKLRLETTLLTNNVANNLTFTIQLYQITTSGTAGQMIATASNASGNTITYTNPSTNSVIFGQSATFDFPATNSYCICITNSATTSAFVGVNAYLYLVYE